MVVGPDMVYVERKGKILLTDVRFDDEPLLMRVIDLIVAAVGRRIDSRTPLWMPVCSMGRESTPRFRRSRSMVRSSRSVNSPKIRIRFPTSFTSAR